MAKHYVLKVYAVEAIESEGREDPVVTVDFDGDLKQRSKAEIAWGLRQDTMSLRVRKKVLA